MLKHFGTEKFGIWNLINSLVVYLSMTNLGLNAAASILINKNSNYFSKIKILKKSLKIIIIILPLILFFLVLFNYFSPQWINIFNSPKAIENEAKTATIIVILFSFLMIPFSLLTSAINGFQKNHIENYFVILGAIFSFLSILYVVYFGKDLIILAILVSVSNLCMNVFKLIYFQLFIIKKIELNPYPDVELNSDTSYKIISITGIRCLFGTLASTIVLNTDNIVIAKHMGVEFVTPYSITFRLYTIIFSLLYIFNSSIVPLIGRNIDNGEYIKKLYEKTFLTVTIIGGLLWIISLAIGKTLIYLWVGKDGYAGSSVLFFLGAYSYVFSIVNLNYTIINTFNYLKGVVYITWLEAILNLILSIFLCKYFGLTGIALGTFLGTFLSPFFLFPLIIKKRSKNLLLQNNKFLFKHFLVSILPAIFFGYYINQIEGQLLLVIFLSILLCLFFLGLSYLCLPKNTKNVKSLLSRG
jgi:O-antigen/teichoic acid export membrane protein